MLQNLNERVDTSTMPFSDKQHLKQNVNLPPLMMMPVAGNPIIQTAHKPQIATLQADFSHFPGVTLNNINAVITSPV